jgi:hypothetical protein
MLGTYKCAPPSKEPGQIILGVAILSVLLALASSVLLLRFVR